MRKRALTEAQAWREIACRIAEGEWSKLGLCAEVEALEDDGLISYTLGSRMHTRILRNMDVDGRAGLGTIPWERDAGYMAFAGEVDVRVLAALFLALEAAEDLR